MVFLCFKTFKLSIIIRGDTAVGSYTKLLCILLRLIAADFCNLFYGFTSLR